MLKERPVSNAKINLERYYRAFAARLRLQAVLEWSVWVVGILCLASLAAYITYGELARFFLVTLILGSMTAVTVQIRSDLKKKEEIQLLCLNLEERSERFRDLLSAWQLSGRAPQEGVSEDLKDVLFAAVQKRLDMETPARWFPSEAVKFYVRSFLILAAVFLSLAAIAPHIGIAGLKKIVLGGQMEFEKFVQVEPKGGEVVSGEDEVIKVGLLQESHPFPRLLVEFSGRWQEIPAESSGKVSIYRIKSIVEKVRFKVEWKNLSGGPYALVPVEVPSLTDFKIRIEHPAYTELPAEIISGEPQLSVLRGTKVRIEAVATKDLEGIEMAASNGIVYPVALSEKRNISVEFTALNPFDFYFDMKDRKGSASARPVQYRVAIQDDRYPEIRLLAPSQDLAVGRESKIPFTFEIKDDFGSSGVFLDAQDARQGQRKINLKRYSPPILEKIDDGEIDVASLNVNPGEVVKMRLEVRDTDTVTGPKSGYSQTIVIEIQSYEKEHEKIEEELKGFRSDLLSVLADQTLNRKPDSEWKAWSQNPAQLEKKLKESAAKQTDSRDKTRALASGLNEILKKMAQDPLTDYEIYAEHRAMKDALDAVHSGPMDRAGKNFSEGNWAGGLTEQDHAIAELERISDISEQVMKHNKMKDLVHSADRLEDKGKSLEKALSGAKTIDSALAGELRKTLSEAMRILSEIQKQIQDLPQELPEDFVNRAAMKNVNLGDMAQSAEALNQALRSGDLQSALQAARQLLQKVKSAREAISKSAEDTPMAGQDNMAGAMQEKSNALESIVNRQEELLRKTLQFEGRRKESALAAQKNALKDLARRQKAALERVRALQGEVGQKQTEPGLKSAVANSLAQAEPKMQSVLKEFEGGNVIFSQKWLKEIVDHISLVQPPLENYLIHQASVNAAGSEEWKGPSGLLEEIKQEEQDILNRLRDSSALDTHSFSGPETADLKSMAAEQRQIAEQTGKLKSDLAKLSARSAQVKPEIMESLKNAGSQMQSSEGALKKTDTQGAAESQESALSYLRKGQQSLQDAQSELSMMRQSAGSKPNLIQPRNPSGGQANGQFGTRMGAVKIPGAEEYLPPKEFREEILESLKEKYPRSEEEVIKQYYKKITQ